MFRLAPQAPRPAILKVSWASVVAPVTEPPFCGTPGSVPKPGSHRRAILPAKNSGDQMTPSGPLLIPSGKATGVGSGYSACTVSVAGSIFAILFPMLSSAQIELLDHPRLQVQISEPASPVFDEPLRLVRRFLHVARLRQGTACRDLRDWGRRVRARPRHTDAEAVAARSAASMPVTRRLRLFLRYTAPLFLFGGSARSDRAEIQQVRRMSSFDGERAHHRLVEREATGRRCSGTRCERQISRHQRNTDMCEALECSWIPGRFTGVSPVGALGRR
jgi:hypothetical protein